MKERSTEMATTSGNLVAGEAISGQFGSGNNGRHSLKAKVAAGVAVLGCAAALTFGGLQRADSPAQQAQPVAIPGNVALAQTQSGNGYLEFSPGNVSNDEAPAIDMPNVARTRTQAGAGYLEFLPGEGPGVGSRTNIMPGGIGFREYLEGEGPVATLPLSAPTTQPAPMFGPQP
jgi:hypothetical protein